jgi:WD40-like Beta Propeller Repeat
MPASAPARRSRAILAMAGAMTLLAACGGGSRGGGAQPAVTVTATAAASASASASASAGSPAAAPAMVAVTTAGALEVLNPASGAVSRTLVPGGVLGDEISVTPDGGTVYFTHRHGCTGQIESVPVSGGAPVLITSGSLPDVSPDGTKLAFAREPAMTTGCLPDEANLTAQYKLVVRTLATGAETSFHMVPASQSSGLPAPISHLSWAPGNSRLAVSIDSIEDNEGWNVVIVDTLAATYYLSGAGDSDVPVTGRPNARDSYLREGVFLPNGSLFVSRACCGGVPIRNTSRLMWEVSSSGVLIHQVAVGFADLDHTSLDASPSGRWLLYLAGTDMYVSDHGATPRKLAAGLIAAAWA